MTHANFPNVLDAVKPKNIPALAKKNIRMPERAPPPPPQPNTGTTPERRPAAETFSEKLQKLPPEALNRSILPPPLTLTVN
jgi:hypothetical protein